MLYRSDVSVIPNLIRWVGHPYTDLSVVFLDEHVRTWIPGGGVSVRLLISTYTVAFDWCDWLSFRDMRREIEHVCDSADQARKPVARIRSRGGSVPIRRASSHCGFRSMVSSVERVRSKNQPGKGSITPSAASARSVHLVCSTYKSLDSLVHRRVCREQSGQQPFLVAVDVQRR